MTAKKPNGRANILADAMRRVIAEAVEEGTQPLKKSVDGVKEDVATLRTEIGERFKSVETDMQNGFAELRPSD